MTATVLLRLEAPLQSWGTRSRFGARDTERDPSKSGIIGLVGAAMGLARDDEARIAELASLGMVTRVDRPGTMLRDFQTAGGGEYPGRAKYGVAKASGDRGGTVLSNRDYLADASFVVGLEGELALVERIDAALADPVWPLFLGRRSCPPALPVRAGLRPGSVRQAVLAESLAERSSGLECLDGQEQVRLVVECDAGDGEARRDVPTSFVTERRRFAIRYVRSEFVSAADLVRA